MLELAVSFPVILALRKFSSFLRICFRGSEKKFGTNLPKYFMSPKELGSSLLKGVRAFCTNRILLFFLDDVNVCSKGFSWFALYQHFLSLRKTLNFQYLENWMQTFIVLEFRLHVYNNIIYVIQSILERS